MVKYVLKGEISMNHTLNEFVKAFNILLPYLRQLIKEDHIFAITDGSQFIQLEKKNLMTPTEAGDPIPPEDTNRKVYDSGEPVFEIVPKEIFGVEFNSSVIPIKDDSGNVVGTFALAKSLKKQVEILEIAQTLADSLNQISSTLSQLSAGIQNAANLSSEIHTYVMDVEEENKKADEITKFINNIASQTNLLGLNAAIEAARAGDSGRGFGVVADEIRKLSKSSSESIKNIQEFLKKTDNNIKGISSKIENVNEVFQEQAAGIEEITASVEELNATAHYLRDLSADF